MTNYAVVALDASASMRGQENRVVESMNKYVMELPDDSHITVFMFDYFRWDTYYDGEVSNWPVMQESNYRPGAMTPLFDAVAKAVAHADTLASEGDRVMLMVDTDGRENASKEHTQESIKALVDERTAGGWAFLFMSQGMDHAQSKLNAQVADKLGMVAQNASVVLRTASYARAGGQTVSYFATSAKPISLDVDVLEKKPEPEPEPAVSSPAKSEAFYK
jgi:hypothetical protein